MLGVFDDALFPEASVDLAFGDTLIAFSDGVTDAVAPDGSDFGMDRLLGVADAHRADSPAALLAHLLGTVQDFVGPAPPIDDVTVAVARYGTRP
jgi:sigma-B regulation protein RsbU (phosphoserine phosphatase)